MVSAATMPIASATWASIILAGAVADGVHVGDVGAAVLVDVDGAAVGDATPVDSRP
jgi:hypothetical protein